MHNLIVHSPEDLPVARSSWMRCEQVTCCICVFSVNLCVEDTRKLIRIGLSILLLFKGVAEMSGEMTYEDSKFRISIVIGDEFRSHISTNPAIFPILIGRGCGT